MKNNNIFHNSLTNRGIAAYILGVILVGFYIFIYFFPEFLSGPIAFFDPISHFLKNKPADRWFMSLHNRHNCDGHSHDSETLG
jgi:hypothetical protein